MSVWFPILLLCMMNLWIKVAQLTFFHVGLGTFCRPCPEMDGSVNINFFLLNFRSSGKAARTY